MPGAYGPGPESTDGYVFVDERGARLEVGSAVVSGGYAGRVIAFGGPDYASDTGYEYPRLIVRWAGKDVRLWESDTDEHYGSTMRGWPEHVLRCDELRTWAP